MSEYMTLVGADDVARAGSAIRSAADEMSRAAMNIAGALESHQRWMGQWLEQFAEVVRGADVVKERERCAALVNDARFNGPRDLRSVVADIESGAPAPATVSK